MSDDTPTQRYPVGDQPVPPAGGVPPTGGVPSTEPLPGETPTPGPAADAPTERFTPPPPPAGTDGTGTGDEPKKSKALLITLICIGAALLLALIILLIVLFTSGNGGGTTPSASPSETSASPTPTETSPSPTPTQTDEPVVPGPEIASYTAAPTTVDCSAGGSVPVHFTWAATGTTLWFGVGTNDASAEPFGTFPTTHEMDFNYQCGQTDAQQRYTITVQGENGDKTSQTIVVRETS